MNKTKITLFSFILLLVLNIFLILFLSSKKTDFLKKNQLIKYTKLPDLAISTEANYIRHRSIATFFDIYKDDPDIRVYFPSTFSINQGYFHEK